jgi:hypothetical protein
MSSTAGRLIRILAGIAFILTGMLNVQGTAGTVLVVIGLVPLIAGLFNFCVVAPLFGGPFLGKEVR